MIKTDTINRYNQVHIKDKTIYRTVTVQDSLWQHTDCVSALVAGYTAYCALQIVFFYITLHYNLWEIEIIARRLFRDLIQKWNVWNGLYSLMVVVNSTALFNGTLTRAYSENWRVTRKMGMDFGLWQIKYNWLVFDTICRWQTARRICANAMTWLT